MTGEESDARIRQDTCPECGGEPVDGTASPDWDVFGRCENDHTWLMEEAPIPGVLDS